MYSMLKYATVFSGELGCAFWNHAGVWSDLSLASSSSSILVRMFGSAETISNLLCEMVCKITQGL